MVKEMADDIVGSLERRYKSLDAVPAEELTSAAMDVENKMRAILLGWTAGQGDKLR